MRTFNQLKKYLRKDGTDYIPLNDVVMLYEGKTVYRIEQTYGDDERLLLVYEDVYDYEEVAIDPEGDYNLNQIEVYQRIEWDK